MSLHKFIKFLLSITVFCLITSSIQSYATTYYVDIALGNDSNSGLLGSPWWSFGKALNAIETGIVIGGDIILIKPGKYRIADGPKQFVPSRLDAGGGTNLAHITISVDTSSSGNVEITGAIPGNYIGNQGSGFVWSTPWTAVGATECTALNTPWTCCTGAGTGCNNIFSTKVNMTSQSNGVGPGTCFQPNLTIGGTPTVWETLYSSDSIPLDMPTFPVSKNACWFRTEKLAACTAADNPWRCCTGVGTGTCLSNSGWVYAHAATNANIASLSPNLEFPAFNILSFGTFTGDNVGYIDITNNNNGRTFFFTWATKTMMFFGEDAHDIAIEDSDLGYMSYISQTTQKTSAPFRPQGTVNGSGFPRDTGGPSHFVTTDANNGKSSFNIQFRRSKIHHGQGDEAFHISATVIQGTNTCIDPSLTNCTEPLGTAIFCDAGLCNYQDSTINGNNVFENLEIYEIPWEVLNGDTTVYGYSYSWPPPSHVNLPIGCTIGVDCWGMSYSTNFSPLGGGGQSPAGMIDLANQSIWRDNNFHDIDGVPINMEANTNGSWPWGYLIERNIIDLDRHRYAGTPPRPQCATCKCLAPNNCSGFNGNDSIRLAGGNWDLAMPGGVFKNNLINNCWNGCLRTNFFNNNNVGSAGSINPKIVNNTFVIVGNTPNINTQNRIELGTNWGSPGAGGIFKNNIIINNDPNDATYNGEVLDVNSNILTSVSIDYNLYGLSNIDWNWGSTKETTFTGWKTTSGQDANSPSQANALFLSASNLHLQTGSPGINAGIDLSLENVVVDIDNEARPIGIAFEIGGDETAGLNTTTTTTTTLSPTTTTLPLTGSIILLGVQGQGFSTP